MRAENEAPGTGRTYHGCHESVDGNGRNQVQPQFPDWESHHVYLYPMGQHDEMSGRRMSALG